MKRTGKRKTVVKNKPFTIVVSDSFHTGAIVETLQNHFGSTAVCYAHSAPKGTKVDAFFLSGRDILSDGAAALQELRKSVGSPTCKIIAVSVLPEYLERIKGRKDLGVDGTIGKGTLVHGLDLCDEDPLDVVLGRIFTTK
jgi:hypothetical protein